MAITLNDDHEIFRDGDRIVFPRDGNHSPSAFLTGFDANDDIVFGRFTSDGRLKVEASISVDNMDVDIGDVHTLLRVGSSDEKWSGIANGDGTFSGLVVDPRMSFSGTRLLVDADLTFPSDFPDAGSHSRLDSLSSTLTAIKLKTDQFAFTGDRLKVDSSLTLPSDFPDAGTHARLDVLNAKDIATEATLAGVRAKTDGLTFSGSDLRVALRDAAGNAIGSRIEHDGSRSINANLKGLDGLVVAGNSTTALLGANAEFIGTAQDTLSFSEARVFVFSNVASAVDGLFIEFSHDGIFWPGVGHKFTILPGGTGEFSIGLSARFFRVRYKNGATPQGTFVLQTILRLSRTKPSTHRIGDNISDENDAELVLAAITGQDPNSGLFGNAHVISGRLQVSVAPAPAPPGTTPISEPGTPFINQANNTTVDAIYTIPNGKTLEIQRLFAGASAGDKHQNVRIELYEDPNGNMTNMVLLDLVFLSATNELRTVDKTFVGNGIRRIVLRSVTIGAAFAVFRKWEGFLK